MVHHAVGSLGAKQIAARLGPRGCHNSVSRHTGQLDRCQSDTTACSVNEDRLGGLQASTSKEGTMGGGVGNSERSALRERNTVRQRLHLSFSGLYKFRISTGQAATCVHAIAGMKPHYTPPHRLDDTGRVGSGGVRELG